MMKKIAIALGILALLFVLLIGACIFGTFHYLNSDGFRDTIVLGVNKNFQTQLHVESLSVGLGGVELQGIRIPNLPPHQQENFLAVKSLKINFKWFGNSPGSLPIGKIEVSDPALSLYITEKGGADFPFKLPPSLGTTPGTQNSAPTSPADQINLSLSDINVQNASLKVSGSDNSTLLESSGADVTAAYDKHGADQKATANLQVGTVRIMPGVQISNFKAPLIYESNQVKVSQFTADCHGGHIKGLASANLINGKFNAEAHLQDVETAGLLTDLGSAPDTMNGNLTLNFTGQGLISDARNLSGQGDLKIPSPIIGKLQAFKDLGGLIGMVGGVSALKDGKFDEINSKFTLAEQKIKLDPLNVDSRNLSIQMSGTVGFDKKLDLTGNVRLAPGLLQVTEAAGKVGNLLGGLLGGGNQNPPPDAASAQPADNKAAAAINMPLTVTGTADNPKVGLTKATQDQVQQTATEMATEPQKREEKKQDLNSFLNNFNPFKKSEPAPAPNPAP